MGSQDRRSAAEASICLDNGGGENRDDEGVEGKEEWEAVSLPIGQGSMGERRISFPSEVRENRPQRLFLNFSHEKHLW